MDQADEMQQDHPPIESNIFFYLGHCMTQELQREEISFWGVKSWLAAIWKDKKQEFS